LARQVMLDDDPLVVPDRTFPARTAGKPTDQGSARVSVRVVAVAPSHVGQRVPATEVRPATRTRNAGHQAAPSATHSAASTTAFAAMASSASLSRTLAGTIRRPRIRTAGNSPAWMARYSVIGDVPSARAALATLRKRGD